MKKYIFTTAVIFLIGWQSYAQINQGRIVITGGVKYEIEGGRPKSGELPFKVSESTSITSSRWKSREMALSPSIGYFILEGLEIGIAGTLTNNLTTNRYSYRNTCNESEHWSRQKTKGYVLNPYITQYIMLSDKFGFLATAAMQYGYEKSSVENRSVISSSSGIEEYTTESAGKESFLSVGISPGIVYFVSTKFALKAHAGRIGYAKNLTKYESEIQDSEYKTKNVGLSLGSGGFIFGLSYYFGGN